MSENCEAIARRRRLRRQWTLPWFVTLSAAQALDINKAAFL
ncbi:hypothetical protein [Polaromonas sp. CG9_12]|nr:hypothetical protein [Polaromonas sp. CG9_12]